MGHVLILAKQYWFLIYTFMELVARISVKLNSRLDLCPAMRYHQQELVVKIIGSQKFVCLYMDDRLDFFIVIDYSKTPSRKILKKI